MLCDGVRITEIKLSRLYTVVVKSIKCTYASRTKSYHRHCLPSSSSGQISDSEISELKELLLCFLSLKVSEKIVRRNAVEIELESCSTM